MTRIVLVDIDLRVFKDNTGNAMPKGAKMIPYLRTENLKNHTLSCCTYLYGPYMGVTPLGLRAIKANQCAIQINWSASHDLLAFTLSRPKFFFTFGN